MSNGHNKDLGLGKIVFSTYITTRNGRRIYASWYGLKAFCFRTTKKSKKKRK